ncbi:MAG: HD domain-containing protein [Halanaerobiaceae bacterium]
MEYRENIMEDMKEYFRPDWKRIRHTLKVTDYADQLIKLYNKNDINPQVIIYSALLHDIGIKRAEEKYNNSMGKYQELEGPPIARKILAKYPLKKETVEEICTLIGHHHSPGEINTTNFKMLYDADWLVNLPAEYDLTQESPEKIKNIIMKLYFTEAAKTIARRLFLPC